MDGDDDKKAPLTTRRSLLKSGLVATVGISLGCGGETGAGDAGGEDAGPRDAGFDAGPPVEQVPPPESVTESSTDFPLGVASGDATETSAIFWTSYAGASPIELVIWEMDGDTYGPTVFVGPALPIEGYAHVDVDVLQPGVRYRFTFFVNDAGTRTPRSAIGNVRAALAADAMEPLVIGAVSCCSNTRGLETLGNAGLRTDFDAFIYLGDTTYNDGSVTLAEYRAKWIENMSRPEFRAVRAASGALATWDDHEFDNDYHPEDFDAAQRANAVRAFFDHQPVRRDPAAPDRVWKNMRWGRTLELFVLDCRNERRPSREEYVSREQMDWLKAGLSASTATFKIIANSVPISDFPLIFDVAQGDRWEGYPAQRAEILGHIDDNAIPGVLWLAGDFHLASAGRVATSGVGSMQLEILAGPGGQNGNLLANSLFAPQFDFSTSNDNYTVFELDPTMRRITVSWIDGSGSVIETRDYDFP